jgi:hypothetical protein
MNHVHLIFDGPGMCAVANPQESLTVVRATGRHENQRAFPRGHARQFRKLDVVANGYRSLAEVGFKYLEIRSGRNLPFFGLESRHVELVLRAELAGGTEEETTVVNRLRSGIDCRDRSGNDIHRMHFCELTHHVHELRELAGEIANLVGNGSLDVAQREQLCRKVLGKNDNAAFVIDSGFNQRRNLICELLEVLDRPNEVLECGDA